MPGWPWNLSFHLDFASFVPKDYNFINFVLIYDGNISSAVAADINIATVPRLGQEGRAILPKSE